jgi:hypothetical protein
VDKERNINMLSTARSFNILFVFGKEMAVRPLLMNLSAAPAIFGCQKFSSHISDPAKEGNSLVGGLGVNTGTVCSS